MNYNNYTDDELVRYAWLRATEWPSLPGYIMMGLGPLFLPFVRYWPLVASILIINIAWSVASRFFYVHLLSDVGMWLNKVKWVSAPGIAIYELTQHHTSLALAAITWPFVAMFVAVVAFGGLQGINQQRVLKVLDDERNSQK